MSEKIHRSMPDIVRTLCWNFDAWIVGSTASLLYRKEKLSSDWDVIVPPRNWQDAAMTINLLDVEANSFGGWKISGHIDVWPETLDGYFLRNKINNKQVAFHPKTGMFVECKLQE